MANTKISQLTANTNPTGNEELVYAYNNTNGKMTVNTMKTFIQPDLSGYQEKLVNQSNIKSINGESLLGSGNLIIQGGGGGSVDTGYDCVVDASGNGDYTTITAAIADGNRSILVLPGTYNETEGNDISDTDRFVLHGVDKASTIINVSLENSIGALSSNNYFIEFNRTTADSIDVDITGVTFNVTLAGSSFKTSSIFSIDYGSDYIIRSKVYNCNFNVLALRGSNFYIVKFPTNDTGRFTSIMNSNNYYNLYDNNTTVANSILRFMNDFASSDFGSFGEYDSIVVFNTTVCRSQTALEKITGCNINMVCKENSYGMFAGENVKNSSIKIYGNSSTPKSWINVWNATDSYFWVSYPLALSDAIDGTTAIPDWASSTSYSVGDIVFYSRNIYQCIEAHTSTSSFDWDKFSENLCAIKIIGDSTGNEFYLGSGNPNKAITFIRGGSNKYDSTVFANNHIECGNVLFAQGTVLMSNNQIRGPYVQLRTGNVTFNGNRHFNPTGDAKMVYADNYNIITNNVVSGMYNAGTIGVIGGGANVHSIVDNNQLVSQTSLS